MNKQTYSKPAIKTYGDLAKITLWGTLERVTGLSSGSIKKQIPSEYRDDAVRYIDKYSKKFGG